MAGGGDDGVREPLPTRYPKEVEETTKLAPQAALGFRRGQGDRKQTATALLDLIKQKRQHHQVHEHGAEVLIAVTEIVLDNDRLGF